jgi:hypothetical protein
MPPCRSTAVLAVLAALVAFAAAEALSELATQAMFADFVSSFKKTYPTNVFFRRYNAFKANLAFIHTHNARTQTPALHSAAGPGPAPPAAFTLKMNAFGDLSRDEFRARLGLRPDARRLARARAASAAVGPLRTDGSASFTRGLARRVASSVRAADDAARSKDWRAEGKVGPVKNQGMCGSCWSFSALASVEAAHAIKTGALTPLSEQQLVSCAAAAGNHGCDGGFMDRAFDYLISAGGACSEADYPYTSGTEPEDPTVNPDGECRPCAAAAKLRGYVRVPENDEAALQRAVDAGVVSVAINAANPAFQFAGKGVFAAEDCGTELNHGVAVVGYGSEDGVPYWLVRNSWGATWGDEGYVKMKRGVGKEGICGIAMMPSRAEV